MAPDGARPAATAILEDGASPEERAIVREALEPAGIVVTPTDRTYSRKSSELLPWLVLIEASLPDIRKARSATSHAGGTVILRETADHQQPGYIISNAEIPQDVLEDLPRSYVERIDGKCQWPK